MNIYLPIFLLFIYYRLKIKINNSHRYYFPIFHPTQPLYYYNKDGRVDLYLNVLLNNFLYYILFTYIKPFCSVGV